MIKFPKTALGLYVESVETKFMKTEKEGGLKKTNTS